MRRLVVTGALVVVAVGGWWWGRTPEATPTQARLESAAAVARRSAVSLSRTAPSTSEAPRGDRVRQSLVGAAEPAGVLGVWVRDAMARDGDSDPRLLDALGGLGLRPTWLLPAASSVDPWLAAGLLDLERQVADRCAGCGWDLAEPAAQLLADLALEEDSADDGEVACVVRGVVDGDPDACG